MSVFDGGVLVIWDFRDLLHAPFCAGVTSGDNPAKSSVYAPWIGLYRASLRRAFCHPGTCRWRSDLRFPGLRDYDEEVS